MTRASDTARLLGAGATILDGTTITTADNTDQLTLISTDADANVGPNLKMSRQSASAADGDLLGKVNFVGHNDAGTPEDISYGDITGTIIDATDGTEDGMLVISTMHGGSSVSRMRLQTSETVFKSKGDERVIILTHSWGLGLAFLFCTILLAKTFNPSLLKANPVGI